MKRVTPILSLLTFATAAPSAGAEGIAIVPFERAARDAVKTLDFETVPLRAEPGIRFDQLMVFDGIALGERFAGQSVAVRNGFDTIDGLPSAPLTPLPGNAGGNLSVAFHQGFGSNALFPLSDRFPDIEARGEGSVAILFARPQSLIGFRIHSDYPDPLGTRPAGRGHVTITFYTIDATEIGMLQLPLTQGVNAFGFETINAPLLGMVIQNDDPGGIALDDIRFDAPGLAF